MGRVEAKALKELLDEPAPAGDLDQPPSKRKVPGYDLTFSAPKSVSVVFGIAEADVQRRVMGAHVVAVDAALAYLEREAVRVRRGHGGRQVIEAAGLLAAAFDHRTSRAGDQQLHTHVLIANQSRGADGRWSAIDELKKLAPLLQEVVVMSSHVYRQRDVADLMGLSRQRVEFLLVQAAQRVAQLNEQRHDDERPVASPRAARLRELEEDPPKWLTNAVGRRPGRTKSDSAIADVAESRARRKGISRER